MAVDQLLPEDPQYEYSSSMSLVPLRRKLIPYAPGKAPNELAVPGFLRSMANDLWMAFTAPGNALAGKYSEEELPAVGMQAGAGLSLLGAGVPAPAGAFASGAVKKSNWANFWDTWDQVQNHLETNYGKKVEIGEFEEGGLHKDSPIKLKDIVSGKEETGDVHPFVAAQLDKLEKAKEKLPSKEVADTYGKKFNDLHGQLEKYGLYLMETNEGDVKVVDTQTFKPAIVPEVLKPEYFSLKDFAKKNFGQEAGEAERSKNFNFGELTDSLTEMNSELAPSGHYIDYMAEPDGSYTFFAGKIGGGKPVAGPKLAEKITDMMEELHSLVPSSAVKMENGVSVNESGVGPNYAQHEIKVKGDTYYTAHNTDKPNGTVWMHGPGMSETKGYKTLDEATEAAVDFNAAWKKAHEAGGPYGLPKKPAAPSIAPKGGSGLFSKPTKSLEPHPTNSMREATEEELDWEYNVEYGKYGHSSLPANAFTDRADFANKYYKAPLTHLSYEELSKLDYGTIAPILREPSATKMQLVKEMIGTRRDVDRIKEGILNGSIPPPIVTRTDQGLRLLGGNTRLMVGAALGKSIPVKLIDLRTARGKGLNLIDETHPVPYDMSRINFEKWFEGSKLVDAEGKPMKLYHATDVPHIKALDPELARARAGSPRNFISLTTDPNFANKWKGGENLQGDVHYPVYVNAKNPGDFRDPKKVEMALQWYGEQEIGRHFREALHDGPSNPNYEEALKRLNEYKHYKRYTAQGGSWEFWERPDMWKDLGWDGAFMTEHGNPKGELNLAVPEATQIKSIFNKGHWNPEDPRLLYSGGTGASAVAGAILGLEPVDHDPFALAPVDHDPFSEEERKKHEHKNH